MAYNNAIPQADDRLQNSQADLLENFASISALLGVNHVISPWTDPATGDQGKHKYVTFPEQGSDPTTAANEMAMYTKVGATSAVSELYIRRESSGTVLNCTESNLANSGYSFLPSGLKMNWGRSTVASGSAQPGSVAIVFDDPFVGTPYIVLVSIQQTAGTDTEITNKTVNVATTANTGFTAAYGRVSGSGNFDANAFDIYYVAIGV